MQIIPGIQTKISARENTKKSLLIFLAVIAIIIGAILISFLQLQTPKVVPADDTAEVFSADRAFSYLEEFALAPHPLGSSEHDRVRDYLVDTLTELGVQPEIQKTNSLNNWGSFISGGTVENIIAKIEGTNSTKAVMLVSHYDSVPGGPGAADAGSGVAAILETVRILKESKPLQNDVIILITDGEENGLLGAKGFVDEHPWVNDVGLVLNFEARGNEGPSFMFETSENNGWLVKEFVEAAPTPVAHSFIYNLYKLMPNDTDLTMFKEAGLNGLNFAFGEGVSHYHTTSDNLQGLSKESLQHHGEYMLSLVQHFGNFDLTQTKDDNQLFFNVLGSSMITYSEKLVIPFMLFTILLFALTLVHALKRKRLTVPGTLAGFLVTIIGMVASFAIGLGLWKLLTGVPSDKAWMMGTDISFGTIYLISFSIMIFAFLTFLYQLANKKINVGSLTMGALLVWLLIAIATSLLLKAGSYVFVWPLVFVLIGFNIYIRLKEDSWGAYLVTAAFAIPGFLLLSPVIYLVQMLVSMELASALMVFVSLLCALLIPIFSSLKIKANWVMPVIFLTIGVMVTAGNSLYIHNMPTAEHQKASDITYFMDADENKAYWAARHALDPYTKNYINEEVKEGNTLEFFPLLEWNVSYAAADLYDLEAPSVNVISDKITGDQRIIDVQLKTNRQAEEIYIKSLASMDVSELVINGKPVELAKNLYTKDEPLLMMYVAGQAGEVHVKVTVAAEDKMEWIVADRAYSIPETKGERLPEYSTYGDNSFMMTTIKD